MTRSVILERAYDMYVSRELIHGDERLSLVLDSLGYTTGAGYQIWPNQAAFRLDLQAFVAERIDYASLEPLRAEIAAVGEADLSFDEHVLTVAGLYYDYFAAQEEFYLALRFFAMGDERPAAITEAMRNGYAQIGWELDEALGASMERRGRQLRPGRKISQLSATITALVEGFALRERVGPRVEAVEVDGSARAPFAVAMLAMVKDYTEPI